MKEIPDELSSLRTLTPPEDEADAKSTCGPVRRQERRVEAPKRTRRDWHDVASAFFLFLALAGAAYGVLTHCFGSGSQRTKSNVASSIVAETSPRFKKIQELQLGNRVFGENPQGVEPGESDDTIFERVKHCGFSLTRRDENGDESHIRLLSPADWLESAETRVRNVYSGREVDELDLLLDDFSPLDLTPNSYALDVWLELPEMGVVGWGELCEVDEDVTVKSGDGNVVTGTFEHVSNNVIDLYTAASADPIGVTTSHPFWSEDRHDFVPAGELAEGERVLLYSGETKPVVQKLPRPGPQRVYNLEIYSEHVYLVSCEQPRDSLGRFVSKKESGEIWNLFTADGRNVRGYRNANKSHPKTEVPYDENAMPIFVGDNYIDSVTLPNGFTNRKTDKATALELFAKKRGKTLEKAQEFIDDNDLEWHHHYDGIMQLVKGEAHRKTGHTGYYGRFGEK